MTATANNARSFDEPSDELNGIEKDTEAKGKEGEKNPDSDQDKTERKSRFERFRDFFSTRPKKEAAEVSANLDKLAAGEIGADGKVELTDDEKKKIEAEKKREISDEEKSRVMELKGDLEDQLDALDIIQERVNTYNDKHPVSDELNKLYGELYERGAIQGEDGKYSKVNAKEQEMLSKFEGPAITTDILKKMCKGEIPWTSNGVFVARRDYFNVGKSPLTGKRFKRDGSAAVEKPGDNVFDMASGKKLKDVAIGGAIAGVGLIDAVADTVAGGGEPGTGDKAPDATAKVDSEPTDEEYQAAAKEQEEAEKAFNDIEIKGDVLNTIFNSKDGAAFMQAVEQNLELIAEFQKMHDTEKPANALQKELLEKMSLKEYIRAAIMPSIEGDYDQKIKYLHKIFKTAMEQAREIKERAESRLEKAKQHVLDLDAKKSAKNNPDAQTDDNAPDTVEKTEAKASVGTILENERDQLFAKYDRRLRRDGARVESIIKEMESDAAAYQRDFVERACRGNLIDSERQILREGVGLSPELQKTFVDTLQEKIKTTIEDRLNKLADAGEVQTDEFHRLTEKMNEINGITVDEIGTIPPVETAAEKRARELAEAAAFFKKLPRPDETASTTNDDEPPSPDETAAYSTTETETADQKARELAEAAAFLKGLSPTSPKTHDEAPPSPDEVNMDGVVNEGEKIEPTKAPSSEPAKPAAKPRVMVRAVGVPVSKPLPTPVARPAEPVPAAVTARPVEPRPAAATVEPRRNKIGETPESKALYVKADHIFDVDLQKRLNEIKTMNVGRLQSEVERANKTMGTINKLLRDRGTKIEWLAAVSGVDKKELATLNNEEVNGLVGQCYNDCEKVRMTALDKLTELNTRPPQPDHRNNVETGSLAQIMDQAKANIGKRAEEIKDVDTEKLERSKKVILGANVNDVAEQLINNGYVTEEQMDILAKDSKALETLKAELVGVYQKAIEAKPATNAAPDEPPAAVERVEKNKPILDRDQQKRFTKVDRDLPSGLAKDKATAKQLETMETIHALYREEATKTTNVGAKIVLKQKYGTMLKDELAKLG